MSRSTKFVVGAVFGRLTVIDPLRAPNVMVRCQCGTERTVLRGNLGTRTLSCGCLGRERPITHGLSESAEYYAWNGAKNRATNPNCPSFRDYGGRGIDICDGWASSFEAFYADMGARPSKAHSIDRRDNSRGYHCGRCAQCVSLGRTPNCRWATRAEQAANRRRTMLVTIGDETLPVSVWAKRNGITRQAAFLRIRSGWDPIQAVTFPPSNPGKRAA